MTKLIKPFEGSRRFFQNATLFQGVLTKDVNGNLLDQGEVKQLGAFNKEKFHGSKQILRGPVWSESKKQYNIGNISDEELNELVKQCNFYDSKDNLITSANRRRVADPFFNHPDLMVRLEVGESELDDENNPVHKVISLGLKARTNVKTDGHSNPLTSAMVKHVLVDKDSELSTANTELDEWIEIGALFKGLNESKMRKIASAMKLGVKPHTDYELVKSVLGKALMEREKFVKGTNETYGQAFLRLANADSSALNVEHYVATAISKGYLRRKKDQGWLYNGKPIATVESQLVSYFLDPNNQDDYFELERLIGDSSTNSAQRAKSEA